jgi:DnaJ-class molecular chaperone
MAGIAQYYRILELENGATFEEVKQAYKDLATVWHPDRFCNNARLQQKAQDKLKELNQAYEQLKSHQPKCYSQVYNPSRQPQRPQSGQGQGTPKPPQSGPKQAAPKPPQSGPKQAAPKPPQSGSQSGNSRPGKRRQYHPIISLQEAKAILAEYKFKLTRKFPNRCICYESGPFWLDIREDIPKVVLSVPCDSVGTFHRALLSIPCKSVGTFHQSEAQELINLFRSLGSEY